MKSTKRLLAIFITIGMLIGMLPVMPASAESLFEYDFFEDGWVQKNDLNSDAAVYASVVDLGGERGEVIKVNEGYTGLPISSWAFDDKIQGTTVVLSFKFMSELIKESTLGNTFANIYVKDGRTGMLEFDNSNNWPQFVTFPNGDFTYYAQDWSIETENVLEGYGENLKWYQIDSVFDLTNGKVKHYVDGQFLGESNDGPKFLDYVMLVASMDRSDGTRPGCNIYYDDVTIKEVGTGVKAEIDYANTDEERVVVKLNEPISQEDANKIAIVDSETLETVNCTVQKLDELHYAFVGEGFKQGGEYRLSLPNATGAYGNPLKAETIFFNIEDPTMTVKGGEAPTVEDEILFADDFNSYAKMSNAGSTPTYDTTKWNVYKNNWRRGGLIDDVNGNKIMRTYVGWVDKSGSSYVSPIIPETNGDANDTTKNFKSGKIEVNFDLAMFTDTTGEYEHEFQFLLDNGYDDPASSTDHVQQPLFSIKNNQIIGYDRIEYTTYNPIDGFTIPDDDISKFNTFKVLIDVDNSKATLFLKQGDEFVKVHEAPFSNKLRTYGVKTVRFLHLKSDGDPTDNLSGSAIDNITIAKKAQSPYEDLVILDDGFENYSVMKYPEAQGTANTAATANPKRWSIPNIAWEGYGITILENETGDNYLNIRPKQQGSAAGLQAKALLGETVTTGVMDIYFDAALQNPEANDSIMQASGSDKQSVNYVEILLGKDGVNANYPVMTIRRSDIAIYQNGGYGTDVVSGYTNSNDKTQKNKYKLTIDMDARQISLSIHNGTKYETVKTTTVLASTLGTNGYDKLIFSHFKTASNGALNDETMSAFDNVKIIKKAKEVEATFDDNFSSYATMSNPGNTDTFTIIDGAKWSKYGACTWGMGPYISTINNNKVLKIDIWQSSKAESRRALTLLGDENIKEGSVEVIFDASAQNPEANGDGIAYFTFGINDGKRANIYPIFDINREDIITYTKAEYGSGVISDTYKAVNDITVFNKYKVVVNFDEGKIYTYILDGEEFVQLCEANMIESLMKAGIKNFVFQAYKGVSPVEGKEMSGGETGLEDDTAVAVDNVKINYDKKFILPVVKSVRIDGVAPTNNISSVSKNFKIYFNKPMDETTLKDIKIIGTEHGDGAYNKDDNSYSITITGSLLSMTSYTVSVPQSVMDADGYNLSRPYSGVFTTAEGGFDVISNEFTANDENLADGDLADLASGTDIYYDVTVRNSTKNLRNASVIIAAYSGTKLVATDMKSALNIESGASISLAPSVKADGITKVKGYIWDITSIKPLGFYKVITDGEQFRLLGRSEETTDGHSINWPNSGVEFTFTGTEASVYLNKVTGTAYFTAYVDGVVYKRTAARTGWNTIASGLENGTHTVKFVRASEARQGRVWVTKINANNAEKTVEKDRLIEFYGDSYTAGYGAIGEDGSAEACDTQKGYAAITAELLNADANLIAYSGKGIAGNNSSATDTTMRMPEMSQYADIVVNDDSKMPTLWDFSKTTPDLVVIFLGTNDGAVSSSEFIEKYKEFITATRERYGDVKILCLTRSDVTQTASVKTVVDDVKNAGDKNIEYYAFKNFGNNGGDGHPSAEDAKAIANELKPQISSLMGW